MIRVIAFLSSILTGASAQAEPVQRLERDTSSPSLIDLSNGEPGWGEPNRAGSATLPSGGNNLLQDSYWGAARMQFVDGYFRRDGTYVAPYMRSLPRR
jgi:hypothetical protein